MLVAVDKLLRRHACDLFNYSGEVRLIGKAKKVSNLRDRLSLLKKLVRFFNPPLEQILMRGEANRVFEQSRK